MVGVSEAPFSRSAKPDMRNGKLTLSELLWRVDLCLVQSKKLREKNGLWEEVLDNNSEIERQFTKLLILL